MMSGYPVAACAATDGVMPVSARKAVTHEGIAPLEVSRPAEHSLIRLPQFAT